MSAMDPAAIDKLAALPIAPRTLNTMSTAMFGATDTTIIEMTKIALATMKLFFLPGGTTRREIDVLSKNHSLLFYCRAKLTYDLRQRTPKKWKGSLKQNVKRYRKLNQSVRSV